MKRLIPALAVFALAAALVPTSAAAPVVIVNGGGNGTFTGSTAGSHFGFGVHYGAGATGQFQCNMAGNSATLGLREMGLEGTVSDGTVNVAAGTATFSGRAVLHVNGHTSNIGFSVDVHAGGPLDGWLHLTVVDSPLNATGAFMFPVEHVLTGQIKIH
jgi:opacity protein-like surface antigen